MQPSRHEARASAAAVGRCEKRCEVISAVVGLKGPEAQLTLTSVIIVHHNSGPVTASHNGSQHPHLTPPGWLRGAGACWGECLVPCFGFFVAHLGPASPGASPCLREQATQAMTGSHISVRRALKGADLCHVSLESLPGRLQNNGAIARRGASHISLAHPAWRTVRKAGG